RKTLKSLSPVHGVSGDTSSTFALTMAHQAMPINPPTLCINAVSSDLRDPSSVIPLSRSLKLSFSLSPSQRFYENKTAMAQLCKSPERAIEAHR
ncbi:hypothetical protein U1Q18_037979, partial [Sarracenia purpurea var. burkii]